jgi:hypothetical protein
MSQRKNKKDLGTKQAANAKQVKASRSHDKRDYHMGSKHSRSASRHHHSSENSTRRAHTHSKSKNSPSVSHASHQKRRYG